MSITLGCVLDVGSVTCPTVAARTDTPRRVCHSSRMTAQQYPSPDLWVGTLDAKLGLEVISVTANRATGRAPVAGNTQPFGLWHGGATATIMETLLTGRQRAQRTRPAAVGTELNVSLRTARQGWVHGEATALHLGRTSAVYSIECGTTTPHYWRQDLSCRILDQRRSGRTRLAAGPGVLGDALGHVAHDLRRSIAVF